MTTPIPTPVRSLSFLVLLYVGLGIAGSLGIAWGWGFHQGASFAIGVGLMAGNLLGLVWIWWRLFTQKTIAWTIPIIVIKYAVLLISIYYLAQTHWFHVTAAGLGVASFLIPVLLWAVINQKEKV